MQPLRIAGVLVAAALCWLSATQLQAAALRDRAGWDAEHEYQLVPPPDAAPFLAAGYRELLADITWARALVYYGGSVRRADDYRYMEAFVDNILALDPHFERIYDWAASAVTYKKGTATQEEFLVSLRYLEKGMAAFPDDYIYFWRAGVVYWFDLRPEDPELRQIYRERGADLLEQAMRKPNAPKDLANEAAAMRTHLGQKERALAVLQEQLLTTDDPEARAAMMRRFRYLGDAERTSELERAMREFARLHSVHLPHAPPDLFVLVGPEPSPVIDFDQLATSRDLFGATEADPLDLFPDRLAPAEEPPEADDP